MPAYYRESLSAFVEADSNNVCSLLTQRYANDGYFQLLSTQSKSWSTSIPLLQTALKEVSTSITTAPDWGVLLEYPLYRLRRRIDLIILAKNLLFVLELKVGHQLTDASDIDQVEEYALDLRDFHKASHNLRMQPLLCPTDLAHTPTNIGYDEHAQIQAVLPTSINALASSISKAYANHSSVLGPQLDLGEWDNSPYDPVPTIIEAATTIFAGQSVEQISKHDANNLAECSTEVLSLLNDARSTRRKRLIVVTGVPGSGKTLAGLQVAHGDHSIGARKGDIVYLSGNTPLVLVIREALAQDEKARNDHRGEKTTLKKIRHDLQARIQHINDYLKQYMHHESKNAPREHAIVFDEAQRAWDHTQGEAKFGRNATEPELLMDIMGRHSPHWAAIVCLVGAGQEINTGEAGMRQWGEALLSHPDWELCAPESALKGADDTAGTAMFPDGAPKTLSFIPSSRLRLTVPIRSYRSEVVSKWVDSVLSGDHTRASSYASCLGHYPITLTRSLATCRAWLNNQTRGQRRSGLLASSKAVRLLAEGLGVSLTVEDKNRICHWYLKPSGDYRSSNSLEITANEYTCQGLELDYAGVCWGGDLMRADKGHSWSFRQLRGTSWNRVHNPDIRRFILNKYRVFLTRAREGMTLFVPRGDRADNTRPPLYYDQLAEYLEACGAKPI